MTFQKGIISMRVQIVVAFGLLALGGGAYYIMQQQSDTQSLTENAVSVQQFSSNTTTQNLVPETSSAYPPATDAEKENWKTYRNSKFAFEIQHPPHVRVWEEIKSNDWMRVNFSNEEDNLNLVVNIGNHRGGPGEGLYNYQTKTITIAGKDVKERFYSDGDVALSNDDLIVLSIETHRGDVMYATFKRSHMETVIPKVEAIASTLRYLE